MSVFDIVRENVSARQVAEHYGLNVRRNGMACCPFHQDKNPSMKIDKRFFCFGCGEKGDAIDYVSKQFGLSLKDAAVRIAEDFNLVYDKDGRPPPKKIIPKKTSEQKFKETQDYCFRVLCDYRSLLRQWETVYEPKKWNEEWHPLFCEALQNKAYIDYLLDILLDGSVSERVSFITNCGRKVREIEERVRRFNSGAEVCPGKCHDRDSTNQDGR